MALRTGIAAATLFIKELCRVLRTYRPAIDGVVTTAVSGGLITAAQKVLLDSWLDGAQAACDVIRLVSGY